MSLSASFMACPDMCQTNLLFVMWTHEMKLFWNVSCLMAMGFTQIGVCLIAMCRMEILLLITCTTPPPHPPPIPPPPHTRTNIACPSYFVELIGPVVDGHSSNAPGYHVSWTVQQYSIGLLDRYGHMDTWTASSITRTCYVICQSHSQSYLMWKY